MKVMFALVLVVPLVAAVGANPVSSPKDDCERLMNAMLPFAEDMLRKHGEFYPYGGALDSEGKVVSVAANGTDDHPQSANVIKDLKKSLTKGAKAKRYQATALIYDALITEPDTGEKSDAIAVSLNHRDNYSVVVFFPYHLTGSDLSLDSAFAQKGEADIFVPEK